MSRKLMIRKCTSALIILVTAVAIPSASARGAGEVLYVDDDAPPSGNGHTWETAYRFVQDALYDPGPVIEIRVAEGRYVPDRCEKEPQGTGDRFATFAIPDGVTVLGGFAGLGAGDPDHRDPAHHETILSGDLLGDDKPGFINNDENSHHVVTTSGVGPATTLDGFTITAGHADGPEGPNLDGAGINNIGGSPTVSNCLMVANRAVSGHYPATGSVGGGMYNEDASPLILMCRFIDNIGGAGGGGGIYNVDSNPYIVGCTFSDNYAATNFGGPALAIARSSPVVLACHFVDNISDAGRGGAVHIWIDSHPTFINCVFERNRSEGCGGAMGIGGHCFPLIEGCTFIDNTTSSAGGAMCSNHTALPRIRNCAFRGNHASYHGGAVHVGNEVTFASCWFEDNVADEDGGALAFHSLARGAAAVNCVFVGNLAARGGGAYDDTPTGVVLSNCTFLENVAAEGGAVAGNHTSIVSSILWDDVPDEISDPTGTVFVAFSDVAGGWPGLGNIDADPAFVDRDQHDLRLLLGSPCIDAGWNLAVPLDAADLDDDEDLTEHTPRDHDGGPRFVDVKDVDDTGCGFPPIVDMGAFEHQSGEAGQPVYGDIDGNGSIGVGDLMLLLKEWGTPDSCRADLDIDGDVDFRDLLELLDLWPVA